MDVCEVVLSDSSDDSDDLPTFEERVKQVHRNVQTDKKLPVTPKVIIHGISDSEDSDTPEVIRNSNELGSRLSSSASNYKTSNSEKIIHSISSDDDGLPDLEFIVKPVQKIQDGKVLKDILDLEELPDLNDVFDGESETVSKKQGRAWKKAKNDAKEIEREQKRVMREEKKKQKELEKALKESEKEILNSQKPAECIKTMKIIIDHNLLQLPDSQQIFNILDSNNIKHGIEENIVPNSVVWYRIVSNINIENNQIVKEEREEPSNIMILVIPNEEFLKMIHSSEQKNKRKGSASVSFEEFIVSIKSLHSGMEITCVTIGYDKFLRNCKEQGTGELKLLAKQVHKDATEQAIIQLQLQMFMNFHFLDNSIDFGNILYQFTKAIAESPLKKLKQEQKSAFSWYADMDSNCPVKLEKDGSSFIKLWRQQIQQFQNVGPEVAEAIAARYPSPRLLLKAYRQCSTLKEAEGLLQDIVVRRNYGPLGTQKRIGPELSYKMHLFFSSQNGSQLLKR